MGWDISLVDDANNPVQVAPHTEGSIIAVGGTTEADIGVTFNYHECYRLVGFEMRDMDGKSGLETAPLLEAAVAKLGTKRFDNYWAPTLGNAGHALNVLLGWAKQHPAAKWRIS